jgi:hypothetical protein
MERSKVRLILPILTLVVSTAFIFAAHAPSLREHGYQLESGWNEPQILQHLSILCDIAPTASGFPLVVRRPYPADSTGCTDSSNDTAVLLNLAAVLAAGLAAASSIGLIFVHTRRRRS